jgi:flagellar biosynthetic protein FliR
VGPELQLNLARASLVGARVSAMMIFAPFLGSLAIPARIKVGFTVVLTALLYPVVGVSTLSLDHPPWLRIVGGELLVGLVLGLTLQFIFDGVQLAGQILGFQLGYSLVNLIDPTTDVDTPVLSIFHQAVALLIFLQLDIHHWILRGLAKSFTYCRPGTVIVTPLATQELWRAAGGMLVVAVQIAAPALLATILIDLTLGMIGKASPQLPVLFVGLSIKSVAAFAILVGSLRFWPSVLEKYFLDALQTSERLMHLVR